MATMEKMLQSLQLKNFLQNYCWDNLQVEQEISANQQLCDATTATAYQSAICDPTPLPFSTKQLIAFNQSLFCNSVP